MKPLIKFAAFFFIVVFVLVSCQKKFEGPASPVIITNNKPPLVNAGIDQMIVLPNDSATLNGSASTDPDGSIISYKWLKISGPVQSNIIKPDSSITVVKALTRGVYLFELKVTDNGSLSAKDTVQIIIDDPAVNQPPIAKAGSDQIIKLPINTTTIDGSGSIDPEGSVLIYSWSQLTGPNQSVIINTSQAVSSVNNLMAGVYLFELKVTDNGGLSAKDTVQIIIDNPAVNQPPIAKAGADQVITLPINTTTIDGNGSIDPEGSGLIYSWRQLSGPNQSVIINASQALCTINNLVAGTYSFELKVTDNGGLFSNDTVAITVISSVTVSSCIQLIRVGSLSIPRYDVAAGTAGNKIFFAGGFIVTPTNQVQFLSRIDIYDVSTQSWTTAELSEPRGAIAVLTVGNKILFASGGNHWNQPYGGFYDYDGESTRVDIYDVTTNTWSTTEMPAGLVFLDWLATAVAAGNKAIFCQAFFGPAFIYDVITNSWTDAQLTVNRNDLASASLGNKALIASGGSDKVDVYDAVTNTWTVQSLSESRGGIKGATLNNKAFFAGGNSSKVDIYDNATQSWSVASLSRNRFLAGIAPLGQKMLFFGYGDKEVEIYDATYNTWSTCRGTEPFYQNSLLIAAGGNLYASHAGIVWRVQL